MAIEFSAWDEQVDASTHVVSVRGEVDLFTAPEFKQRIHEAIDDGRTLVIVDLTATTFIDSSSLGILISSHKRLRRSGGQLVIACDSQPVLNTFAITGLDGVLTIVPSREDGLELSSGDLAEQAA
jgi:anti-sigma B factor antagonist